MTVETYERFFALLTLAALAGTILVIAARLVRRVSPRANDLVLAVASYRTPIAALLTTVSMVGSLYFSEVAHFTPCTLCWDQRIAMHSLAIICVIASFSRDEIRPYVIVLSGLGAGTSLYHWLLERLPDLVRAVRVRHPALHGARCLHRCPRGHHPSDTGVIMAHPNQQQARNDERRNRRAGGIVGAVIAAVIAVAAVIAFASRSTTAADTAG